MVIMSYEDHIRNRPGNANIVTHQDDPDCAGHDINLILIAKSRELGQCVCIHPFMNVINFAGLGCSWCGEQVPENAISPEMKELRTQAVRAVLGDGSGGCVVTGQGAAGD
jgi:hypothetical protein